MSQPDDSAEQWQPRSNCPRCGGSLIEWPGRLPRRLCERCAIAIAI